ncbi:protein phosphatase inhibitor Ypi1 domain-containing protein [Phanerochaete sordida]|uniref:Type 1 phosphatases regulator n=1 Tax=Phanerochaete sordida TaxID=48140 RepID=A0A9P3G8M6_9APHY|nr:protein phosphatase inhibitor Ypi1 domain-containing protein [Phanerochaete sordida]
MLASRPSASAPSDGSRTITIQDSQPRGEDSVPSGEETEAGTLRLRGGPRERRRNRPGVLWREDVVDNEHMGKKSSKICCIYHKPRKFGESSSEESSDSDSDTDSHHHRHRSCSHRSQPRDGADSAAGGEDRPEYEPNAYERQPGRKSKKGKAPGQSTSS